MKINNQLTGKTQILLVVLVLSMVIILAGILYFNNETERIRNQQKNNLQAVVSLKSKQISSWYKDELYDAKAISQHYFINQRINSWLSKKNEQDSLSVRKYFRLLKSEHDYESIILADIKGNILISSESSMHGIDPELVNTIHQVVSSQKTLSTGVYQSLRNEKAQIGFVAPILDNHRETLATLILEKNPDEFIYPFIKTWPSHGNSSEVMIVRRESDGVLYLNELKFKKNSAFRLNIPLSTNNNPAVQAVKGKEGIFEGIDYRGKPVLAYMQAINETPWFIIAKIDKKEIFSDLRTESVYISLFVLLLVLFIAALMSYLFSKRRQTLYKELWKSQEIFKTTLYSIGDAVITTNKKGEIQHMNEVAFQLTGWSETEARGKDLEEVFSIFNEHTQEKAENPAQRILKEGTIMGLANHTTLISKNGRRIPIADSGAPIKEGNGEIMGMVLVFRDQTEERNIQKQLHESEERFRRAVENVPDVIVIYDTELKIKYVNSQIKAFFGNEPDFFMGKKVEDIFPADKYQPFKSLLDNALNTGEIQSINTNITLPEGSEKHFLSICVPFLDEHGEINEIMNITQDLTEYVKRETEYKELLDGMNDTVFVIGFDGYFLEVNETTTEVLGYTRDALLSMGPVDIDPYLKQEDIENLIDGMKKEEKQVFETQHQAKDGTIIPVEISSSPINYQGEKAILSIARDISERKKSEEQIKLLSRSIEQSPVSVVITDPRGVIEYVNPKYTRASGYSFQEVYGRNSGFLKSGYHSREFYQNLWNTILAGKDWHGEFKNKKKNGELFWENAIISPIVDEKGEISHFVEVKEDITDKKQMIEELKKAKEEAEKSDNLKSAFLANISHEIRTPMNGILGFSTLLQSSDLSIDQKKEYLDMIQQSGKRMLNLIDELIHISKIVSRQVEMHYREVSVNEMIDRVLLHHQSAAEKKGLSLDCYKDMADEDSVMTTDEAKLENVLNNLILNAIKFTHAGKITFGYKSQSNGLEFYVKDTGIGIDPSLKEEIFDHFRQADTTISRPYEGAGLGLSIARAYVDNMGGTMRVDSVPNKGSVFYFTIPFINEKKKTMENPDNRELLKKEKPNNKKKMEKELLIVEDDEISVMYINETLKNQGIRLIHAGSGTDSVRMVRSNPNIELVLMDIKLPEMDGYEATREIKQIRPELPVIAQTAYALEGDKDKAMAAGCDDYITKPIQKEELMTLISRYLK